MRSPAKPGAMWTPATPRRSWAWIATAARPPSLGLSLGQLPAQSGRVSRDEPGREPRANILEAHHRWARIGLVLQHGLVLRRPPEDLRHVAGRRLPQIA